MDSNYTKHNKNRYSKKHYPLLSIAVLVWASAITAILLMVYYDLQDLKEQQQSRMVQFLDYSPEKKSADETSKEKDGENVNSTTSLQQKKEQNLKDIYDR